MRQIVSQILCEIANKRLRDPALERPGAQAYLST